MNAQLNDTQSALLDLQRFKLERDSAFRELEHKSLELEQLRLAVDDLVLASATSDASAAAPTYECNGACEAKLATTELELARQMDALKELQWQIESIIQAVTAPPPTRQDTPSLAPLPTSYQTSGIQTNKDLSHHAIQVGQEDSYGEQGVGVQQLLKRVEHLSAAVHSAENYRQRAEQAETENEILKVQLQKQQHNPPSKGDNVPQIDVDAITGPFISQIEGLERQNRQLKDAVHNAESEHDALEVKYKGLFKQYEELLHSRVTETKQRAPASLPVAPALPQERAQGVLQLQLHEKENQINRLLTTVKNLEKQLADAHDHHNHTKRLNSQFGATKHTASNNLPSTSPQWEYMKTQLVELETENAHFKEKLRDAQLHTIHLQEHNKDQNKAESLTHHSTNSATKREGGFMDSGIHSVEILQRRIKVLETSNARLQAQLDSATAAGAATLPQQEEPVPPRQMSRNTVVDALYRMAHTNDAATSTEEREAGGVGMQWGHRDQSPAVAKWQADKKLQRKIETLQIKLQEKASALSTAKAHAETSKKEIDTLRAELTSSQTACKDLKTKLKDFENFNASRPPSVPAEKARALLAELTALQAEHDSLERQILILKQHNHHQQQQQGKDNNTSSLQGSPVSSTMLSPSAGINGYSSLPSSTQGQLLPPQTYNPHRYTETSHNQNQPSNPNTNPAVHTTSVGNNSKKTVREFDALLHSKELTIMELQLERDQAKAQCVRLQHRLDTLFADLQPGHSRTALGLGLHTDTYSFKENLVSVSGSCHGRIIGEKRKKVGSVREKELLDTIALLRSALERTKKGLETGVSSSRYMAAVDKIKSLKAQITDLHSRLTASESSKDDLKAAQTQIGQLESLVSALRSQLCAAKLKTKDVMSAREQIMNAQVEELERAVAERDVQLAGLRHSVCEEARALAQEGLTPSDLVQHLLNARSRLRDLESINNALRLELNEVKDSYGGDFNAAQYEANKQRHFGNLINIRA